MIISARNVYKCYQTSSPQDHRNMYKHLLVNTFYHHLRWWCCCSARTTLILINCVFDSTVSLSLLVHSNKWVWLKTSEMVCFFRLYLQSARILFTSFGQYFSEERFDSDFHSKITFFNVFNISQNVWTANKSKQVSYLNMFLFFTYCTSLTKDSSTAAAQPFLKSAEIQIAIVQLGEYFHYLLLDRIRCFSELLDVL